MFDYGRDAESWRMPGRLRFNLVAKLVRVWMVRAGDPDPKPHGFGYEAPGII
jgi:hypothetical protein